ncbi:MAG: TlpA family protein disulfide reductase [Ignavibacteria bacterium]|nr:TlpA family protein disulfide reductase [Ignavibacteria bacterium]
MKNILSYIVLLILPLMLFSCGKDRIKLSEGNWRGIVNLNKDFAGSEMPFIFILDLKDSKSPKVTIINADEKVVSNEVFYTADSLLIKLPVFKDEIRAKIFSKDSIAGEYYHVGSRSRYSMPFYAVAGAKNRFDILLKEPAADLSGKWETTVSPGDSNAYKIVGEFVQKGNLLTGTFLTTAGDQRYLDGVVTGNKMMLSAADGYYTVLVKADISSDGKLENGYFIRGPKSVEKWMAVKNPDASLPPPDGITELTEGTTVIDFTFSDLTGKRVSLSDEKYKNKPVIVQIMGSWCPNCMDETRLFKDIYAEYNPKGLQIIGLCFESGNFEESKQRIERFASQIGVSYDFLYAGEVGKNIKETLPFIKKLNGYPTTLYLDKNHNVVKIYTGFSGPGTGPHYVKQKEEIINTILKIL